MPDHNFIWNLGYPDDSKGLINFSELSSWGMTIVQIQPLKAENLR